MLYLATSEPPSLVKDNYYKEGKSINADLAKRNLAKALGLSAVMQVNGSQVWLSFEVAPSKLDSALNLHFYHATMSDKDFDLLLLRDASGDYRATADRDLKSKWILSLEPLDQEWEIRQQVSLPIHNEFVFAAK